MNHHRRLISACLSGLALAAPAAASERATATASAQIVDAGGITVLSPLVLPTVVATSSGATFSGDVTYAGTGGTVYARNARLTIRQEAGEALSMTVPSEFTVVRTGGSEALTVKTTTRGEYGLVGDGVLMSGALMNGVATSVDISGQLALASAKTLVPGPYEGMFAVVVEYN
jgi:hypothetical protein